MGNKLFRIEPTSARKKVNEEKMIFYFAYYLQLKLGRFSGRITDIEIIRQDTLQFNLLYLSKIIFKQTDKIIISWYYGNKLVTIHTYYRLTEWIQNSDIQNSDITKQRLLQNSDNYITATFTKQQLLQNGEK